MSEAAALTEQITGLLTEQERAATSEAEERYDAMQEGHRKFDPAGRNAYIAGFVDARLADSRPVVSEAAIRACAIHLFTVDRDRKGLTPVDWEYANDYEKDFFTAEAKVALTAALPHMGDEKADAESCDVCGLTGHTCGGQPA